MQSIGYAIDVSHHQHLPNFSSMSPHASTCIIRASYGKSADRSTAEHYRRARGGGFKHLGLYHFFRPQQPVEDQIWTFCDVAAKVGYGQAGDVVPVLDIERDTFAEDEWQEPSPRWIPKVARAILGITKAFGVAPMIYITKREIDLLGFGPIKAMPLWIAHYTSGALSRPENVNVRMWQHRVGPFDPEGPGGIFNVPGKIDQSRILKPLPLFREAA